MNRRLLAAALAFTSLPAFAADATGTFDRTFTLSTASPGVSIDTGSGYIHVYPGTDTQFHVTGHVRANTGWFGPDAEARVRQIVASPPVSQTRNMIAVGSSHGEPELYRNISIDYEVMTPRASTLKVSTGSGSIEIGGIQGAVTGHTGSGHIHADNLGPNARLRTGSGSIEATNIHGAASLETGSGSIRLSESATGDVQAETGSGAIHIDGVSGGLRATAGSGSIEIAGTPSSEWRVTSGSGHIDLALPASARFNLIAETSSGAIHMDRPVAMQGSFDKHHVSGPVNGGGPTVRATTASGSITLQ